MWGDQKSEFENYSNNPQGLGFSDQEEMAKFKAIQRRSLLTKGLGVILLLSLVGGVVFGVLMQYGIVLILAVGLVLGLGFLVMFFGGMA